MKILIRNINRDTTEEALRDLFEAYGAVQYCTLIMDAETGKHKGFGFVEMPKAGDAKAAIVSLNNTHLDGSVLRVKRAIPKELDTSNNDE
ncbi:RNA-binding protein [Reinekea sp. G2M2-21]|jgi:RNA recognition motif-containing protein|uniref:RNA recognition motif domain-containing protein n=1 Tax=Reinekea sp. G2M2-21 TaxID=2788942 RepID=UPI0018AADFE4|nr:RNA-binding protein [Reinekea sp. G2M2-21]MDX1343674.1 RNA-binding protein [Reinekea sp.]MDX1472777.1 RNA-binding protein [Reinekea sp.]